MTKGTLSREPLLALWRTALLTIIGDTPVCWRSGSAPRSPEHRTAAPQTSILKDNSKVSAPLPLTDTIESEDIAREHDHLCRYSSTISLHELPGLQGYHWQRPPTIGTGNYLDNGAVITYGSTEYADYGW